MTCECDVERVELPVVGLTLSVDKSALPGGGGSGAGSFNLVLDGPEVAVPGEYWEGKQVYARKITYGALPNNAQKDVAHGIPDMDEFVLDYTRSWMTSTDNRSGCINQPGPDASPVTFWVNKTNIMCRCYMDRRIYSAKVVILYTKTTDQPVYP